MTLKTPPAACILEGDAIMMLADGPFGRLQDERVAAGERHRKHPERHHHRKVERRDPGADAERLQARMGIDGASDRFGVLPLRRCGAPHANSTTSMPR
jgi:hypothetical protein